MKPQDKMKKYILALDQGTTSSRAIVFDCKGNILSVAQKEVHCFYPFDGAVEQDAEELYTSILSVITSCLEKGKITPNEILAMGIANQRETTILFDRKGKPLCPAIVWQSKQSSKICESLKEWESFIQERTGLILNPYFSASKIRYLLDQYDLMEKAEKGEVLFGTVETYLLYRLTEGKSYFTEIGNASRTLLLNIKTKTWDDDLLHLFHIPRKILPEIKDSSSIFGYTSLFSNVPIPIAGILGDQQSSLFGQTCFEEGELKNTYGTGCFLLMNIGKKPKWYSQGLLTTIAWGMHGEITYALEGSVLIGGAAIQWLRDELKIIKTAEESETCARNAKEEELYVVPAFVGLGTPYWDNRCKGAVFGLRRSTNKDAFVKATLESIAYESLDVLKVIEKETQKKIPCLQVDGGASNNAYLMQFQSDLLGCEVKKSEIAETTALGVFYLCLLTMGKVKNLDEIKKMHRYKALFSPRMDEKTREEKYKKWQLAVSCARQFN